MVKTPKTRHSRSRQEPVTIDLEPGEVSRIADEAASDNEPNREAAAEQAAQASQPDTAPESAYAAGPEPRTGQPEDTSARNRGGGFDVPPASSAGDPEAADEPSRPKRGAAGAVAAGLIGAVIALAGAGGLQYAGLLGAPGGASGDVRGDIASLKGEVAALRQDSGGSGALARLNDLAAAMDRVRTDIAALKTAEGSNNQGEAVAALDDRVKQLESTVATLDRNGDRPPVDLGPVNEKLDALAAQVKSAADGVAGQGSRVAALEQSVSQLSAKVEAQASQPKIALSIAASALKSALERGAPFVSELDTFAAIAPDSPEIAALRPYAEKGVPSRADIAAGADEAANAMVAAGRPVDENAGFFGRLLSSAETLVKVRPVGAVEGPGVPETVARMEAAVKQGDYARALAEYDTLPEAAKAAGASYAAGLRARVDAETRVDALVSSAMKA